MMCVYCETEFEPDDRDADYPQNMTYCSQVCADKDEANYASDAYDFDSVLEEEDDE